MAERVKSDYVVHILHEGYSRPSGDNTEANCSCTLIKGRKTVIVDTMTPWDGDFLVSQLGRHGVKPSDVDYVVSTHGHSDHCGNNNLFLNAIHVVGLDVSHKATYFETKLGRGLPYAIDDFLRVIPTPGHVLAHVSVAVETTDGETIVIAGDLFENETDVDDPSVWKNAGSEDERKQVESREKVLKIADKIVPGHGRMFRVRK